MKRAIVVLSLFAAVSAFADDLELAKMKRTMADMRTLAISVESLATDTNAYPNVSFHGLEPLISPTYILHVPKLDGWGNWFVYIGDGENHYRFVSAGADGTFESASQQPGFERVEPKASENPADDIIFQDGAFIQYPAAAKPARKR